MIALRGSAAQQLWAHEILGERMASAPAAIREFAQHRVFRWAWFWIDSRDVPAKALHGLIRKVAMRCEKEAALSREYQLAYRSLIRTKAALSELRQQRERTLRNLDRKVEIARRAVASLLLTYCPAKYREERLKVLSHSWCNLRRLRQDLGMPGLVKLEGTSRQRQWAEQLRSERLQSAPEDVKMLMGQVPFEHATFWIETRCDTDASVHDRVRTAFSRTETQLIALKIPLRDIPLAQRTKAVCEAAFDSADFRLRDVPEPLRSYELCRHAHNPCSDDKRHVPQALRGIFAEDSRQVVQACLRAGVAIEVVIRNLETYGAESDLVDELRLALKAQRAEAAMSEVTAPTSERKRRDSSRLDGL